MFHRYLSVTLVLLVCSFAAGCSGGGSGGGADITHAVTYDGNQQTGGSAPTDATRYAPGQTVTIRGNTGNLTKDGFAFAGWNTQADGSGSTYTQAQTFAMGAADVTLYAYWTDNPTYTVAYDGNGSTSGSVPADATHYEQGQTVTVVGNTGHLAKTGYAFAGWNTATDGSGDTYTQAQTFTMGAADVTLYALWNANPTYVIAYDGNGNTGGSVPLDSTHYEAGQTVTVLGNTGNLVKAGYSFAGWNTQADGSGSTYTQAQTLSMGAADLTLYAIWTANPAYTVTYDGNGSTGGIVPNDSTHYEQGQTVTVIGNTGALAKTGYAFAGWNTQADGGGTTYTQAQTFSMGAANVTLYAAWTANPTYTMTYNGNGQSGGSVPTDATHYEQGQTVTVLGNTGSLARAAYAFAGWNTQADGNGTLYAPGDSFAMGSANQTLYAKWSALPPPTITSLTPSEGLSTASTASVEIQGTNFTSSTVITVGAITVPSSDCTLNSSTSMTCAIPGTGSGTTFGLSDVTADNGGGLTGTLTNGWRHIGVLNGVGASAETEYCVIPWPSSVSITAGQNSGNIYAQVYQAGVTDSTTGAVAGMVMQLGYGPSATDPTTASSGWTYVAAPFAADALNNDEYAGNIITPAAGTYSYTFRVSRDSGASYTYCDLDGAGSAVGVAFTTDQLGTMTVTP